MTTSSPSAAPAAIQQTDRPARTTHFYRAGDERFSTLFAICGQRIPNPRTAGPRIVGAANLAPGTTVVCSRCELIALEMDLGS